MYMRSFPQIEQLMKSKLDWSYKTYNHRFRDWLFPVDRIERQQVVIDLYNEVSDTDVTTAVETPPATLPRLAALRPALQTSSPQPQQPTSVPVDFFFQPHPQRTPSGSHTPDRMSIATMETWTSGSTQSAYTHNDDTFSVSGFSIMTSASSISDAGKSSQISPSDYEAEQTIQIPKPLRLPKHDPKAGLWNDILRVVPCGIDHTALQWHESFPSCEGCGYSQWHALMIYARHMDMGNFITAMSQLPGFDKMDFAGNYPIHYLMCAGVSMEYFGHFSQYAGNTCRQNVFGQNPIHVLNPQDLGDQLMSLLDWFRHNRHPPGLLLTQRDIYCRTPLHALLQRPLERTLYRQILKVFPFAEHQLRSLDTSGNSTIKMMNKSSNKIKLESAPDFAKIQAGITEVRLFLDEADQSQVGRVSNYGFHDIARGARGTSYYGFFECRICLQTNAHSNSYLDQIRCACQNNRDRNAPDETGMTPAHLIVMRDRSSGDYGKQESAAETSALFRTLIPSHDATLREALHALDKEGNSLIFNIATRGFDEILSYALEMEDPGRRASMVNSFGRRPDGGEWSVLSAVFFRLRKAIDDYKMAHPLKDASLRYQHYEMYTRLAKCKDILKANGAKESPGKVERWRVWV
ncbi:uncharacterized protein LY89DRAFT_667976 [Mollisia scopiformis]|uniref:Uncharacterized protein n=1 Tax=Mollisia scopiformis TaxID=149040 RepID=A0A194XFG3_MOLSC|nr:uncharacterized protein LY89DRAFT_667976 [Mollisia scopiformis]KUJ18930.1 hypothetical protein LY89DRAFT_667976 [Mollisia scopiformis]